MSFSQDTKNELSRIMPDRKCCMRAEIAAFIRVCGNLRLMGGGKFEIAVGTENPAIARHFNKLVREYFNVDTSVEIAKGSSLTKGRLYTTTIGPEDLSEQILRETGILMVREGMNYISDGIYDELLRKKCCRKAYIRGLFLGAGTMTNPEKEYHYEIALTSKKLADDVRRLFNTFTDITPKYFQRKADHVVYFKDSQQILDLLAIMGASTQYFTFEDVRFNKELRNNANRLANCDQANIDKSLAAADRQIRAIEEVGLSNLPPKLAEIAAIRLEHPDLSIKELGEYLDPPLTKAGVNGRLARIEKLAEKARAER